MNYRVIIVDDEPWTRDVIKRLGHWGALNLEVSGEASDGGAGLLMVEEMKPHIVITDMRMPGMDGTELMKALLKINPNIKIIVISGYDDYNYVREAIKHKAMDYLLKPVNPEDLNALLGKCVEELQSQVQENVTYEPDTFLNVSWLPEYLNLRSLLRGCLKDLNRQTALSTLENMREIVVVHEGSNVPMGMIMKIFYDLVWMLEQFIVNENHSPMEVLPEKIVFSSKTAYIDVINYLKMLYTKVIESLHEDMKNRNRIDLVMIQKYVDYRYVENITLESVAGHFYVSKEYLSKTFKAHTGINFSEYIMMRRMEKAKEMILEHNLQIKNVAELLGFSDIAHFYKNFKKYHGITPGEMRKNSDE